MTLKSNFIKFCRYAPPLITQIATFIAGRALATEYEDYGADNGHKPLAAKVTLIGITLLSALTGLLTVVGTWRTSDKSTKIKSVDVVLQLVALIIAIYAGSGILTDHNTYVTAGLACDGPNARVCLPPISECSDKSKPPCDAYVDTDKLVAEAIEDNLDYENHLGWIDGGNKYRTVQYQSYGDISEGWGFFSRNGKCSEYTHSTTTASFDKTNYSAAGKVELAMLKEPAINCEMGVEKTEDFDCGACTDVEVEAFDGTMVTTSSCGVNNDIRWSKAAVDKGDICRYGCIGTNEECLKHGAPVASSDEVVNSIVGKYTTYIINTATAETLAGRATTSKMDELNLVATNLSTKCFETPCEEAVEATKTKIEWTGYAAHVYQGDSPSATETCSMGPKTYVQMCIQGSQGLEPIQAANSCNEGDPSTETFSGSGGDCCLKRLADYGGTVAGDCDAGPAPWLMTCLMITDANGNTAVETFDCASMADAKTNCAACTDPRILPCAADGYNPMNEAQRTTNSTVGFGYDMDSTRFGIKDWKKMEGTWCGAKILQESYSGLFGLTVQSALLFGVSLVMSAWDTITEIREPNMGKASFMALGIILASLLDLLLFLWTPFKTAMIVFIGHDTGPEVGSISAATATTMFTTGELEWAAGFYELISVGAVVLMLLITAHALINIVIERTEPKVAAVSAFKLILVLVGTIFLWSPNFAIREWIDTTKKNLPGFLDMLSAGDAIIARGETDLDVFMDYMNNKLMTVTIQPAGEANIGGDNTGFVGAFVYIITLLITLADEIEIVVLKKMRKKDAPHTEKEADKKPEFTAPPVSVKA